MDTPYNQDHNAHSIHFHLACRLLKVQGKVWSIMGTGIMYVLPKRAKFSNMIAPLFIFHEFPNLQCITYWFEQMDLGINWLVHKLVRYLKKKSQYNFHEWIYTKTQNGMSPTFQAEL